MDVGQVPENVPEVPARSTMLLVLVNKPNWDLLPAITPR